MQTGSAEHAKVAGDAVIGRQALEGSYWYAVNGGQLGQRWGSKCLVAVI